MILRALGCSWIPVLPANLVEGPRASRRELLSRLWLAMPGEPARSSSPSDSIEAVELCRRLPTQGRRQFVGKRFARVVDCLHPANARLLGSRIGELEEMVDDASDLAADRVALALAQVLDLLGDALAIESVVRRRHRAQHLGLVLRPGVEIVLAARSVRHHHPLIPGANHGAGGPNRLPPRRRARNLPPASIPARRAGGPPP